MPYVDLIISRFGGIRPMAAAVGVPPSTVQSWKASGVIPARRQQQVLNAARAAGIPLEPADFFPEAA